MNKFTIVSLTSFTDGCKTIVSKSPIMVKVENKAGMYFGESEILEVLSFGLTMEDCIKDFERLTVRNWEYYTSRASFYVRNFKEA